MEKFELHILGCGSALPTTRHFATSQVVNLREKLFMIDCGEGAQMQLRRSRLKFSRLNHIFISHLHGDHCFGLLGLISTFGLLGRTADLHIHSPRGLEELFAPMLAFFCKTLTYKVFFHEFETKEPYRPSLAEQISNVDLLFHEATFAQTEQARAKETYHTTAAQAAQLALDANVKQLVIGHFSARYEDESILLNEASAIFPQTILAKENMCIDVDGGTVYEK